MVQMKSKGSLLENSLLLGEVSLFVRVKPSTDWVRPITFWRAICFTQSLQISMLNSPKSLSTLTYNINQHATSWGCCVCLTHRTCYISVFAITTMTTMTMATMRITSTTDTDTIMESDIPGFKTQLYSFWAV